MASHRQRRPRARRDSERERELAAEGRDEALLGETEPADPLGQALPDVTEARRAEAGPEPRVPAGGGGGGGGVRPTRNGDDESEPHGHAHAHEVHRKGLFGRAADFLRACVAELRRVQWPDRRQVGQGTAVVIGFVIVAGLYLGALDAIWNPIVQAII
jgi:preprotein translocase SecE subunit